MSQHVDCSLRIAYQCPVQFFLENVKNRITHFLYKVITVYKFVSFFKESVNGGAWKYFSAVCWFYGKNIYDQYKKPIGLIATDWGGTPVESWSSPDALRQCNITGDNVVDV